MEKQSKKHVSTFFTYTKDILTGRVSLLQSLEDGDNGGRRLLFLQRHLQSVNLLLELLLIHLNGDVQWSR